MEEENDVDEYDFAVKEHLAGFHTDKKYDKCSECHKDKLPSTIIQDSNLSKLRASIEAQRALRGKINLDVTFNGAGQIQKVETIKLELKAVPEITLSDNTEFNLERHGQLCERADVLYHNFLVGKQSLVLSDDSSIMAFEGTIKDLAKSIDEVVDESAKIRWS